LAGKVLYKSSVSHDFKNIDADDVQRILREIRQTLGSDPSAGEALSGEFKGLLKLRVGDYRVINTIVAGDVLVLRVGHRSKVYR
jgi:mRNA interferase RelE/StbE